MDRNSVWKVLNKEARRLARSVGLARRGCCLFVFVVGCMEDASGEVQVDGSFVVGRGATGRVLITRLFDCSLLFGLCGAGATGTSSQSCLKLKPKSLAALPTFHMPIMLSLGPHAMLLGAW